MNSCSESKILMKLIENISNYSGNDYLAFHCPTHIGRNGFADDLTELPGLDNLQYPSAELALAQEEIASFFRAERSYLLTGGASLGLQVALLALDLEFYRSQNIDGNTLGSQGFTARKKKLLLARNVHKSVIAAILQTGFDIDFLELEYNSGLDLYTAPDFSRISSKDLESGFDTFDEFLDFVNQEYCGFILTNPSYDGFYTDLSFLDNLEIPLIVDEAHGAHYYFSDDLPSGALSAGADLVIQSWHKCLGALTQSAVVHLNKDSKISQASFEDSLRLLHTTSPSYLIIKSILEQFTLFKSNGESLLKNLELNQRLVSDKYLSRTNHDFTRMLLKVPDSMSLEDFDSLLEVNGVFYEAFSNKSVLLFLSVYHNEDDFQKLESILEKIYSKLEQDTIHAKPIAEVKQDLEQVNNFNFAKQVINPKYAYTQAFELVDLNDSLDRISADFFALCPPGFPVIIPGQIINRSIIDHLKNSEDFMNLQDGKIKVLL